MLVKYITVARKKEVYYFNIIFCNWSYVRIRENFLMK